MAEKLAIYDEEKTVAGLRAVNTELDVTMAKFRETITVVNQASQAFNRGTPRDFVRGMQLAQTAQNDIRESTNQLTDAQRRLLAVQRQRAVASSEEAPLIANISAQTRILTAAQRERANAEERLAAMSERERQRLGNTLQIYTSVQQRLTRLQAEYRNLAVAKQLGAQLTDREIARMEQLERRIQRYDSTLRSVDASMGRHQRNVGNYASGFNAMNNSVAQMAREMPAFTYSMQTGFMALSNNIPIFADALAAARVQNAQLRAEGQATVPVWKQVTTAFASWNILLSVGITLLTVYGQKIFESIKNMVSMKTKADVMAEAQENLNKQMSEGAADSIVKYKTLQDEWNNLAGSIQSKNKFIVENADKFRDLGVEIGNTSDAEKFFADGSENFIQVLMLRAKAAAYAQTAIETYKKAIQEETQENKDFGAGGWKSQLNTVLSTTIGWRPFDSLGQQASDAGKKAADEMVEISNKLNKEAVNLQKRTGIKTAGKGGSSIREKSSSDVQKDLLRDLEAARDTELAVNERMFVKGLQDERKYLEENLRINTDFYDKKIKLLSGKTAEERKLKAEADLEQSKLEKDTQSKLFDIDRKVFDENHKKQLNELERQAKDLENGDFWSSTDRIDKQIETDTEMIAAASKYYDDLIDLAVKKNQPLLEIERKRDEEINGYIDRRAQRQSSLIDAAEKDLEKQTQFIKAAENLTYEEQRQIILQNKSLSIAQKQFQLQVLERVRKIRDNEIEIKKLETLKQQLQTRIAIANVQGIANPQDVQDLNTTDADIKNRQNENRIINDEIKDQVTEDTLVLRNIIANGFADLGFPGLADTYAALMNRLKNETADWKDYAVLAASAVLDSLSDLNNRQKESAIAALDEQLEHSKETTDQELGFINDRLEQLNALETLTAEQAAERNRLEAEARTFKEQQFQREKLIEAQKARAEQKAAANQAVINGALAATKTLAELGFAIGAVPAALALAFGVAQSVAIMSKDPVPKYKVGRKGGKSEFAITQDGGREMITNSKGEIKSLGSDKGDALTWLEKGDNVHTAKETRAILSRVGAMPKVGDKIFQKIAMQSLMAPAPIVINKNENHSAEIAERVGKEFEKYLKKYDKPVTERINGKIIRHRGANFGEVVGYYDTETGAEISLEDYQKKQNHD